MIEMLVRQDNRPEARQVNLRALKGDQRFVAAPRVHEQVRSVGQCEQRCAAAPSRVARAPRANKGDAHLPKHRLLPCAHAFSPGAAVPTDHLQVKPVKVVRDEYLTRKVCGRLFSCR